MKSNFKPWLYGPDWQGQRCEAKTRRGTLCRRPAKLPVGKCKLHGGRSTGARTADGLARLVASKTTHGKYTAQKRAAAKRFAEHGRQMKAELAELESWFVDHGYLKQTKDKLEAQRYAAMVGRRVMGELRRLEQQILDAGLMPGDLYLQKG